ncbi:MAG: glycosyltransferase involved in cell wall biosynthesis [Cyclobacteriaceae bacterium]
MKIAIIINTSWNIYNFREGLVHFFLERGDEVMAIAPKDDYSHKLQEWGCEYMPVEIIGTGMNPIKDLRLILVLRKKLKKWRPDVVLTYTIKPNLYGSIAAGSLGIPCICNVSGLGTVFLWTGWIRRFAVLLYTVSFRFNKWVFFQNDEDREDFLSFVRLPREKTSLLPGSGINTSDFMISPFIKKEKTVFLMIARLIVEKGVGDFIEAIRIIKKSRTDLEFILVGNLDQEHSRAISKVELNQWIYEGLVTYKGHLDDVKPEIQQADVIVLPSYREGTPRTLLEGGAMGKALLATDVPGCRHVVKDGYNGFLFESKNPRDLADKMKLYLALNQEERSQMAVNSRKWIKEVFEEKIVINLYAEKMDQLVKE